MAISPRETEPAVKDQKGVKVMRAITIQCPADALYSFWRQVENLPLIMHHLVSVKQISARESHWVAKAPMGKTVEWDAEIINETQGRMIAWRTKEGETPAHAGTVRFDPAPGNQGTEVRVTLEYDPPGGKLGALVAKLFGEEPAEQISDDLHRLKALLETGVIPTTKGQPVGCKQKEKNKQS
ncbi:MAG TPA: SRPBCC family protein [Verrucomicrobiae bacterium]